MFLKYFLILVLEVWLKIVGLEILKLFKFKIGKIVLLLIGLMNFVDCYEVVNGFVLDFLLLIIIVVILLGLLRIVLILCEIE